MHRDRDYFGIRFPHGKDFTLKRRLWARLVEKLITMRWEKDLSQQDVYRFFDNMGNVITLRIAYKTWEEGSYRLVELIDDDTGKTLAKEEFHPDGLAGSYAYHPLSELFELVGELNIPDINELKNLAQIL